MKILAFTDTHGSPSDILEVKKKAKDVDIIINIGDFTIFENEIEYNMDIINKFPKKVLLIHGNHEDEDTVEFLSKHFKNIKFIHKKVFQQDGIYFIGYGGGGFSTHEPEFDMWIKKIESIIKDKKVVLLLHGPPYDTKLDKLSMGHVGNKSFTKFIKEKQPILTICGHLHENFNKEDKIKNSIIINPGPEGRIIDI